MALLCLLRNLTGVLLILLGNGACGRSVSEHERRGGPANRIEWQIRVGRESEHRRSGADRKCSVVCMLGC